VKLAYHCRFFFKLALFLMFKILNNSTFVDYAMVVINSRKIWFARICLH
jgi:hypothetical protein